MALVIPGQSSGTGLKVPKTSSRLIIPGVTDPVEASSITLTRERIAKAQGEAKLASDEASKAENAARFLNVLGGVAKNIGQGIARSFESTSVALATGSLDTQFTPKSRFDKALFGDKPFSIKTIGEDFSPLLEKVGVSRETAQKLAPYTGIFLAALDITPFGKGAKLGVDEAADIIAKQTLESNILTTLKKAGITGGDKEIKALAASLRDVTKPEEVKGLIRAATGEGTTKIPKGTLESAPPAVQRPPIPETLKDFAKKLTQSGLSKREFLDDFGERIKAGDARAAEILTDLKDAALSPGRLFDLAHGRAIKSAPSPDRILGKAKPQKVVRNEMTALKDRLRAMQKGAREGAQGARETVRGFQTDVIGLINRFLPPDVRGKHLTTVRNTTSIKSLEKAMERIGEDVAQYESLLQQANELSTIRSRIGFIRKVGEFNQTAVNDAKRQLGIQKPLRKMDKNELRSLSEELKKRFAFKREEGLITPEVKPDATSAPQAYYDAFTSMRPTVYKQAAEQATGVKEGLKEYAEDFLGVISTRLANIDKTLKYALRRYEFNSRQKVLADTNVASELAQKVKGLDEATYRKLDVAMKNGFIDDVNRIAKDGGFLDELQETREMLNRIYDRANEVGLEVGYLKNFFPRSFKQSTAAARGILEYFARADKDGLIDKAFRDEMRKLGRPLSDLEKVNIINTLLRGFKRNQITLSKTGSLKERVFDTVTPELNEFYADSFESLFKYVESVNNLIEARRFFGKHLDMSKLKATDDTPDLTDVISAYVNNLVAKGQITSANQAELQRILSARFSGKPTNRFLGALKDVGYLSVMSSFENAVTQLGDLAFAFYRNGAPNALGGVKDAFSKSRITREDLGIGEIAQEFSDRTLLSKGVNFVFKATGLNRVDRLGKETFINGVSRTLRQEAVASPEALTERLRPIFGDETGAVVADLRDGVVSDNVKYLLFNELLDFQPAALSEVPLKYLESPNGRVLYALKTYTIKLFDVYRREVVQQAKTDPKQAAKNMVRLAGYLALFNASAGEIRDFISGRETDLSDKVVDNLAKSVGFGRYQLTQIPEEGLGRTLASQILPPTQLIDDLSKDMVDVFTKDSEDLEVANLRSFRNIPVGGKLYYWWLGRGAEQQARQAPKERPRGTVEIPSVEIPVIQIPSVSI